jgi:hypothetical protein
MHREVREITNFSQCVEFKMKEEGRLDKKMKTRLLWESDLPTA